MSWEHIVVLISEYGYSGLFFYLWIGVFAVPIPNELIIVSLAFAASKGYLNPAAAYLVGYLGIISALTTSYLLGRSIGMKAVLLIYKRPRYKRLFVRSEKLMKRFHAFSLFISCFIPGIRLLLPFLFGFYKLPFKNFILYSYSGVFVWLALMFFSGYKFGKGFLRLIIHNEQAVLAFAILLAGSCIILKAYRFRKKTADTPIKSVDKHM